MLSSLVMELMEYSKNTITVSHRYEAVIFILLLFCVDHKHYAKRTIIDENGKDWEWIYISHLPWKGFEKKLYKLVDGKLIPHWQTEEHELLASIATYQLIKGNGDELLDK